MAIESSEPTPAAQPSPLVQDGGLSQEVVRATPHRLTPEVVRYRESVVWEMRKQGWTQYEIAQDLGISQQAVSKIARRIDRRILKEMEADAQLLKVRQARRLNDLFEAAMGGWHASCAVDEGETKTIRNQGGYKTVSETTLRQEYRPQCG